MLSRAALIHQLRDRNSGFAVTPLVDEEQIDHASIDLRLGPDMIVVQRETGVVAFDPVQGDFAQRLHEYQQYVRRPFGSAFYLHPREFAIARTLEWVTLPKTLGAQATGRSSWGRLGLVIATATLVQPGFKGTITLELSNVGTVPIVLHVGVRIAQLSFFQTTEPPAEEPNGEAQ